MILLIDNYDSFVHNLARYVRELGGEAVVRRNDAISLDEIESLAPSHIVLSPGPCSPVESGISVDLVRRFGPNVPILGVCLGHQCIAHAFGGRIVRARRPMHGKPSEIRHDGAGVFERLPNPFSAMRYHSLVVEESSLPADFVVTARTPEGEVMGIRHRDWPLEGVQFHPESYRTNAGTELLRNFLAR
jgi:para-aminobenzoate synthetase component 2